MQNSIAVVYLARFSDGPEKIERFIESYKMHPAGIEHDLVIIIKGAKNEFETNFVLEQLKGLACFIEYLPDTIGVDIHAYLEISKAHMNEYFVFFNTHSEIATANWLSLMHSQLQNEEVGLVGAFGSAESIYTSWEVLFKAQARFSRGLLAYHEYKSFNWILEPRLKYLPKVLEWAIIRALRICKQTIDFFFRIKRNKYQEINRWVAVSTKTGTLSFTQDFPSFPNPHIRSNAFMVRRFDLIQYEMEPGKSKLTANLFECGRNSLSKQIIMSNRKLIVVGKNGEAYEPKDWEKSNTFRSGSQENLLIYDNQTRSFAKMSSRTKEVHKSFSWGENAKLCKLSNIFEDSLKRSFEQSKIIQTEEISVSIIIPTHNRNVLLDQALFTALSKKYKKLEIIVFDNASEIPVSGTSQYANNPQVKLHRSDEFLSVTNSWNQAISHATGDYLIFLGDDDGILPNFYEDLNGLVQSNGSPDLIVSPIYQFFHPGVIKERPNGMIKFLRILPEHLSDRNVRNLNKDTAQEHVLNSLDFRRSFNFQMPGFAIKRDFLFKHCDPSKVFESPFPDYYLANLILWHADRIAVSPIPITFQGISAKSFGSSMINLTTEQGFKILNSDLIKDEKLCNYLLPGSQYWNSYLITMDRLANKLGFQLPNSSITRYRKIRIIQEVHSIQLASNFNFMKLLFEIKLRRGFIKKLCLSEKCFMLVHSIIYALESIKYFRNFRLSHLFFNRWNPYLFNQAEEIIDSIECSDNVSFYQGFEDEHLPV
jgi:glycosyltransferase involved in cell wall biosynthesis